MSRFRFVATILLAITLGLLGLALGEILPLPEPFSIDKSRALYALLGILIGLMSFAKISSWIVLTTTRITRQMTLKVASEVINQLFQLGGRNKPFPTAFQKNLEKDKEKLNHPIILDTSSIIDGRILDVAKCGFLTGTILIPEFVLRELQLVADSADGIKRARGRKGFETINALKKIEGLKVIIWDKEKKLNGVDVDDKLINLSQALRGRLLTTDYNLNKVATLRGVKALNLNDLSNALKSLPIPGEILEIKLTQPGKDKDQGVGFLSDGTMVVVQNGAELVGQSTLVEVTKILQGPAGRMIFGKKV